MDAKAGRYKVADLGLADRLDAWVLETGQRAGIGHMGMHDAGARLTEDAVDGGMDAVT